MLVDVCLFWLVVLVGSSLALASYQPQALAQASLLVVLISFLLVSHDLDLLGAVVFAIYSSVFILLTLLSVHLTPYWSSAAYAPKATTPVLISLVAAASLTIALLAGLKPASTSLPWGGVAYSFLLWQDLYCESADPLQGSVALLHWSFYRLFILDTVLANIYLCLGLVVSVGLLLLLRYSSVVRTGRDSKVQNLQAVAKASTSALRLRLVAQFRRQTRRKNSSIQRTRR